MQETTHEYRFWVRIRMTDTERAAYRAEHALADGESTRDRLAAGVQVELDGLGAGAGWWHDAHVN
ncbi:hypothetical protein GCM10009551_045940 [Nocardiopsis tropica]